MEIGTRAWTYDTIFVDGGFAASASDRHAEIVSPRTEEVIGRVPLASAGDVDRAVDAARRAFDHGEWPRLSPADRAAAMRRLADALDRRQAELTELGVDENGYPIAFSEAYMATMPAINFRMYADIAETYPFEEEREGPAARSLVLREPVGVAVLIPPFNGPLTLGTQKAAPALAAGCTVILKGPIQNGLACYVFAEAVEEAGLPPGVVNVLVADAAESERLVAHPGVDKVSFTGSTPVGKRIAELCGRDMRRVTLELGGKSAAIMLDDVDVEKAVPGIVACSVAMLQGEICTAQSRIIVPRSRYDEITDAFAEQIAALPVGDPAERDKVIGPMITRQHRERVEGYVGIGRDEGATVKTGGGRPSHLPRGWYLEPTLLTDCTNDMRVAQEEIFGPVTTVIRARGFDDAVRISNGIRYGLSSSIFTRDVNRAFVAMRDLQTGITYVNAGTTGAEVHLPFGGTKATGNGHREAGTAALETYTEYKSLYVDYSGTLQRAQIDNQ
jgi:aldehyde dehydrogenase (NAD+)